MIPVLRRKIHSLLHEDYWAIGISDIPVQNFINQKDPDIRWIQLADSHQFVADPFGVQDESNKNHIHIFYEVFNYYKLKGSIAYALYDFNTDQVLEKEIIIEEPYHLSYPFVIRVGDVYYMIPEKSESGKVELYKAKKFPTEWVKDKVILEEFSGIDPTIIYYENKFWLFSTNKEEGQYSHLYLFYSDSLDGEWKCHPENPVKFKAPLYRSAGNILQYNGKLIRPSMDSTRTYGENILLNQIDKLNEKQYSENIIGKIKPIKGAYLSDKIHTISSAGRYTMIDSAKERLIFSHPSIMICKIKRIYREYFKLQ